MPDSPPKRVTRARAKAVERTEATADAPKVTTTAKKTAVNTKKVEKPTKEDVVVVKPTATTKRKTRADDVDEQALRGTQAGIAKTSNGRAKKGDLEKSEMVEDDAATKTEGPKLRGRPKKVTVSAPDDMPAEPQKSRGRPKKTITDAASTKVESFRLAGVSLLQWQSQRLLRRRLHLKMTPSKKRRIGHSWRK